MLEHYKFKGYIGTWYAIDSLHIYDKNHNGRVFILWEHETYGDEAGHILTELRKATDESLFLAIIGGDMKFQPTIIRRQARYMLRKLHQKILMTTFKIQMY